MNRIFPLVVAFLAAAPLARAVAAPAAATPAAAAAIVTTRLDAALQAQGMTERHEVKLGYPMLMLPPGMNPDTARIENLHVDGMTGRLTAILAATRGSQAVRIAGQVYRLADVVVPARLIEPGETIAADDLQRATVRLSPGAPTPLSDPAALIGKTPRHPLRAHAPVIADDLTAPIVIHRGDLVTLTLETPFMTLSTQGQAMQDAAQGAPIRVSNTKSKRIIEAVATGPGMASVEPLTVR